MAAKHLAGTGGRGSAYLPPGGQQPTNALPAGDEGGSRHPATRGRRQRVWGIEQTVAPGGYSRTGDLIEWPVAERDKEGRYG